MLDVPGLVQTRLDLDLSTPRPGETLALPLALVPWTSPSPSSNPSPDPGPDPAPDPAPGLAPDPSPDPGPDPLAEDAARSRGGKLYWVYPL